MNTISRSALVRSVEAGIEAATEALTPAEKIALRAVAVATDHILVGDFRDDTRDCGCPLVKIGVDYGSEPRMTGARTYASNPGSLWRFVNKFDTDAAKAVVRGPSEADRHDSFFKVVND